MTKITENINYMKDFCVKHDVDISDLTDEELENNLVRIGNKPGGYTLKQAISATKAWVNSIREKRNDYKTN